MIYAWDWLRYVNIRIETGSQEYGHIKYFFMMVPLVSLIKISLYLYEMCCYYNKILFTNAAYLKRVRLQKCHQSGRFTVRPVTVENNLMFLVSMPKAIFKLNYSYYLYILFTRILNWLCFKVKAHILRQFIAISHWQCKVRQGAKSVS